MVARGQILSGVRLALAAGASGLLTFKAQAPFRPNFIVLKSLGIPQDTSAVIVTNVKVATNEQLIGEANEVPLSALGQDNLLGKLQLDTVNVGQIVTISCTNVGQVAEIVAGLMFGIRLQTA